MTHRNETFDIAKGLGIFLVVIGHTISPVSSGSVFWTSVYQVLYTFHMPLFFFLSGAVSSKMIGGDTHNKCQLIKSRIIRLMIPYFVWAIVYTPMKILMADSVRFQYDYKWWTLLLGNNPDGQLWFLYVLFILNVITILFVNQKNVKVFILVASALSIIAPIIPSQFGFPGIGVSFSLYQVGYYFIGILYFSKVKVYDGVFLKEIAGIAFVIFFVYGILTWNNIEIWYLKAIAAACAIYVIMYLCEIIKRFKIKRPFIYLGKRSMEIFILHAPILVVGRTILLKYTIDIPVLYITVMTVATLIASIVGAWIIDHCNLLALGLFGKRKV